MRILHVLHSIDPRSGGPSHALRALVAAQTHAGLTVSVCSTTIQACEPWASRETFCRRMAEDPAFEAIELFMGRAYGRRRPWDRYGFSPECVRWLRRRLGDRERRPDVVHIHGVFSHLTHAAARLAAAHGIPSIIRPAGSLDPDAIGMRSSWAKRAIVRFSLRRRLTEAAFIHATSRSEADAVRQGFPGVRIEVMPHGVTVAGACPPETLREWYERFPRLAGTRQVLCVGRLHPIKQMELLIRAIPAVSRDVPDVTLVLAGPDSGHRACLEEEVRRAGIGDRVVFTGFLQGPAKQAAYAAAAVFALPSRHENYGLSVVEAMAHGVPVLVSPHVAARDYVDEARAGVTVPDTVADVAAGLRDLLRLDRAELGERGRRFVSEQLSWHTVEQRLRGHYAAVSRASRSRAERPGMHSIFPVT